MTKPYLVLFLFYFSCKSNDSLNYCNMYKSDQSFLYSRDNNDLVNAKNLEKRKSIFLDNYAKLKTSSSKGVVKLVSENMRYTVDSCIYLTYLSTNIHICQTRPDIFYSRENIDDLELKIKNGIIDNGIVYTAIKIGSFSPLCHSLKDNVKSVIVKCQLDTVLFKEIKFQTCN